MKKLIGLLITILLGSGLLAQEVTQELAATVAGNFYKTVQSTDRLSGWDGCVDFVKINDACEVPAFVFQINNDFVVVSSDRSKRPIQSFSLDGKFNPEVTLPTAGLGLVRNLPPQEEQLHPLDQQNFPQEKSEPAAKDYSSAWDFYETGETLKSASSTQDVLPLMSTQWGQEEFYNDSMPADPAGPGGNVMVGCVSTAFGQYLKYIADTEGSFPGFGWAEWTWDNWGNPPPNYPTQYADFENANYNYSLMPNQLTSSTPANQKAEVARFLADLGVAVRMQYGPGVSSSHESEAWYAMLNYFSFNAGVRVMGQKDPNLEYFPMEVWTEMLTDELDAARVFMYGGYAANNSWAHWFVIDGYNIDPVTEEVMFHCNWGWDGTWDGYFPLDNLAPGGFVPLDDGQTALFGMHPDAINITEDTTVSGTWNVPRSILVRETATLTIAPGTVVTVADGAEILVHGALVAIGDSLNKIKFTVADTATERFNSIRINPLHDKTPQSSSIVHCIIEYSERDMPGATQAPEFWGGGIYASFYRAFGHTLDLSHTEVHHCKAFGGGGVVLFIPGVYIGLSIHHNSLFPRADLHGNRVSYGWGNGMSVPHMGQNIEGYDNSITFDSCNFSYNSGPVENGYVETEGALFIFSASPEAPVHIQNSQFIGNSKSWMGVALYSYATVLTLKNCIFKDHIEPPLQYGIPQRGVVYIYSPQDNPNFPSFVGNLNAIDCLFENNDRTAIWTSTDDTVSLINTTMRNHFQPSPEYARGSLITMETETGWGVPDGDVHVNIVNTLAWDNDPNEYLVGVAYESATLEIMPILNIQYSDLQGGNASIDPLLSYSLPSTNIDANPLFATNGQLLANSPCIDAGNPDTTGLNLPEFDVFGFNRIMYGRVDIGVSEYDGTVLNPDISAYDSDAVKIYPNPSHGNFTVQTKNMGGKISLALFSSNGQIIAYKEFSNDNNSNIHISNSNLSPGLYLVKILHSNSCFQTKISIVK